MKRIFRVGFIFLAISRNSQGRCSLKKASLKISQNSQKNNCVGYFFVWILRSFQEHQIWRTSAKTAASVVWSFFLFSLCFQRFSHLPIFILTTIIKSLKTEKVWCIALLPNKLCYWTLNCFFKFLQSFNVLLSISNV